MTCKDPAWMKSNTNAFSNEETFYPAGTECYRDPSQGSCFLFGNSGSGLVRKFNKSSPSQHAFTGPLSMSKSCDQIQILDNQIQYSSENPGVFTDAYCYLPWIAAIYGMKLPENYARKESCGKAIGKKGNINLEDCVGQEVTPCPSLHGSQDQTCLEPPTGLIDTVLGTSKPFISGRRFRKCDFTFKNESTGTVFNECRLHAEEGYAYNVYTCMVSFFSLPNKIIFSRIQMGRNLPVPTTAKELTQTL